MCAARRSPLRHVIDDWRGAPAFVGGLATVVATTALVVFGGSHAQGQVLADDAPGAIKDRYIVKSDADPSALAEEYHGKVRRTFAAYGGFSVTMDEADAREMAADPEVEYVNQVTTTTGLGDSVQSRPPSWSLDRIDQRTPARDGSFRYPDSAGRGVTAYVIDSGLKLDLREFSGRATTGIDVIDGGKALDRNGHGTSVAVTLGGQNFGVAKNVKLVAVRVLDEDWRGTNEGIVEGLNWIAEHAKGPSVANMSHSRAYDRAINDAVGAVVDAGVTTAVSAGNNSYNACRKSPPSEPSVIVAGATRRDDRKASFSNFGSCVDIFAPGVAVGTKNRLGQSIKSSGTSFAAPHVAGAAALYLAEHPRATPKQVRAALMDHALSKVVTDRGKYSPDRMLNIDFLTR
ncbi:S8 family peptidase [Stackebrandtia nassauensis]|uniref:Peptidase S8 and S53 subtilisin kexin sedolisin n=1 Tax=Stackebrandtia nassauensis (strain DSM 44728 / CIP 108903 / NRRL B-16338 / NBRC 102104 / LLR-40K-21) TaxID=446470 RepID=D3PYY6_STANL|nr:S8 family peptidase [Stackebrandtia nassauensis]ADD45415.1 peptidase S8 and S53 subtilisin kexin sedolisin [Stackebrandtia nassauensis DSM 44728]